MKFTQIAKIEGGQDGAVINGYIFRFDAVGNCNVYEVEKLNAKNADVEKREATAKFCIDRADVLSPHSNAVMFGKEYYSPEDEFPLLYTNIYNNYAKTENPMVGVCLVYRLQRDGLKFSTKLVQIIEIGFVQGTNYWKSDKDTPDVRPYGNFTIDRENGVYYGFVMRDKYRSTRYFAFDLPKLADGEIDGHYGVKRVVIGTGDIKKYFDCPYHNYIQGACFYKGRIYSTEGFTGSVENPPALRVIDVEKEKQVCFVDLVKEGLRYEPEMIDFYDGVCYYSDNPGNLYTIDFKE